MLFNLVRASVGRLQFKINLFFLTHNRNISFSRAFIFLSDISSSLSPVSSGPDH